MQCLIRDVWPGIIKSVMADGWQQDQYANIDHEHNGDEPKRLAILAGNEEREHPLTDEQVVRDRHHECKCDIPLRRAVPTRVPKLD